MKNRKVMFRDKIIIINQHLLNKQDCWNDLETIKELHLKKLKILNVMEHSEDASLLCRHAANVTEIEFKLQEALKFGRNVNMHRFWLLPKCSCPKMDNEDMYGTRYTVINCSCVLHGSVE